MTRISRAAALTAAAIYVSVHLRRIFGPRHDTDAGPRWRSTPDGQSDTDR